MALDFARLAPANIRAFHREHRLALAAMGATECGCDYEGAGGIIAGALFKVEDKLKGLIEDKMVEALK